MRVVLNLLDTGPMPVPALVLPGDFAFRNKGAEQADHLPGEAVTGEVLSHASPSRSSYCHRGYPGRLAGLGVAALVHVLITAIVIWDWTWPQRPHAADEVTVVTLLPVAPDRPDVKREHAAPEEKQRLERVAVLLPPPAIIPFAPSAMMIPAPVSELPAAPAIGSGKDDRLALVTDSYRRMISALLAKQRHFPEAALLRRRQGDGAVRFHIDRSGRLLDVAVETTTGQAELDRAAVAMVRRAAPFPAVPVELPDELDVTLPVSFLVIDPDMAR